MKSLVTLTPATPSRSVNLDNFQAVAIFVENPTGTSVLIRLGGNDIPTEASADHRVPANGYLLVPAEGSSFAIALADPGAVSSPVSSNLLTTATVVFLDKHEALPSFGAASFLTLSTSSLEPITAYSGATTSDVYDLGAWGGALVFVSPDAASGQAEATIQVSNDGASWHDVGTYALWPNVTALLTVPRVARYFRLVLSATPIITEPALAGHYSVRATLSEVQALAYNPSGNAIVETVELVSIQGQQFEFVTAGLPAVSLALISTDSTPTAAADFFVEASSDATAWRLVTARTQVFSQGVSRYLALGPLDRYIRVTVNQLTVGQTLTASLYVSTPPEQDIAATLNTIQQSLGDHFAPSNTNQDIYHELDSIRLESDETNAWLGGIDGIRDRLGDIETSTASADTKLTNVTNNTSATVSLLASIEAINNAISTSNTSIDGKSTTMVSHLAALVTSLTTDPGKVVSWLINMYNAISGLVTVEINNGVTQGNIDSKIATSNATLATMNTSLDNIETDLDGVSLSTTLANAAGTGALALSGFAVPSNKIVGLTISGTTAGIYQVWFGGGAAATGILWGGYLPANTTVSVMYPLNHFRQTSGANNIWVSAPGGSVYLISVYSRS